MPSRPSSRLTRRAASASRPSRTRARSVRTFRFGGAAEERLAVYEGRTLFRFNVSVPANQSLGVETVRVNVRFQSCNDEVCFPPATRELALRIAVVGRDTPSNRINGHLRRRRAQEKIDEEMGRWGAY